MTSSASSDVFRIWRWSCNVRKWCWRSRSPATFIIIMSNLMSTYRVVGGQNGKGLIPTSFLTYIDCLLWQRNDAFLSLECGELVVHYDRHKCFLSLVNEDVAELLFQSKLKIWSSPFYYYLPNEKWRLNCSKVALHAPIFLRRKYVRFYDCMRFCHENAISAADCFG